LNSDKLLTILHEVSCGFSQCLQAMLGPCMSVDHDCFLPHLYLLTIHDHLHITLTVVITSVVETSLLHNLRVNQLRVLSCQLINKFLVVHDSSSQSLQNPTSSVLFIYA
jgi:hypothetical protein